MRATIATRTVSATFVRRGSPLKVTGRLAALFGLLSCQVSAAASLEPDPPKVCSSCESWNVPHEPFRIFGNTYYVGTAGLSSILIASGQGLILLDGALPQSALLIAENIRKLGFRIEDVRLIVNSHTHYDHAGGLAALQRASGAVVAASPSSAAALKLGAPVQDDPQFAFGPEQNGFPSIRDVRVISDGETLRVGKLAITARFTPGHTPGGTSWTWRSCEGKKCVDIVYADSLNAVSAPGFQFTGTNTLRSSIARVEGLACDVLLSPHPEFFGMETKLQWRLQRANENPFVDPQACKAYADVAKRRLEQRLENERNQRN
jgi:metallo-beta-lactamase class B